MAADVAAFAFLEGAMQVLLVRRRYEPYESYWALPGGGLHPDETLEQAAERELREETGLTATTWTELCRLDLSNSVTDETGVLFVATGLTAGASAPEPTESLDVRWVPFDEALAMTLDGRITDSMSLIAIQRVALDRRP